MLTRLMPRLREDDATMAPVPHRAKMVPHIIALPGVNCGSNLHRNGRQLCPRKYAISWSRGVAVVRANEI